MLCLVPSRTPIAAARSAIARMAENHAVSQAPTDARIIPLPAGCSRRPAPCESAFLLVHCRFCRASRPRITSAAASRAVSIRIGVSNPVSRTASQVDAVHPRHHHIEVHRIDLRGLGRMESLQAVSCQSYRVVGFFQPSAEHLAHRDVVFHYQNPHSSRLQSFHFTA